MDVVAWDDRMKVVRPSTLLHKLHMHTLLSLCLQPQLAGRNTNSGYSQSCISTYSITTKTHKFHPKIFIWGGRGHGTLTCSPPPPPINSNTYGFWVRSFLLHVCYYSPSSLGELGGVSENSTSPPPKYLKSTVNDWWFGMS